MKRDSKDNVRNNKVLFLSWTIIKIDLYKKMRRTIVIYAKVGPVFL